MDGGWILPGFCMSGDQEETNEFLLTNQIRLDLLGDIPGDVALWR